MLRRIINMFSNKKPADSVALPGKRVKRVTEQIYGEDILSEGDYSDVYFTKLAGDTDVDLDPDIQERTQKACLLLYRKNPRAHSYVEVVVDFCVGDGFQIVAADPRVQELIDTHLEENEWDTKLSERIRSHAILGELLLGVDVDKLGTVHLGAISPFKVKKVFRDPGNAERLAGMTTKPRSTSLGEEGTYRFIDRKTMRELENEFSEGGADPDKFDWGRYCFYFPANFVSGADRGYPDLGSAVDWLEGLDAFTFTLLERSEIALNIVYDLMYEGLDGKELAKKAADFADALSSGGINAHNEKSETKVMCPELAAADAKEIFEVLSRQIYAATRFPGMFFGDSSDLTRASATELSIAASRKLSKRQGEIKNIIRRIVSFQIMIAKQMGLLEGVTNFDFRVELPQILLRDLVILAKSLDTLIVALDSAVTNQHITHEYATAIILDVVKELTPPSDIGVNDSRMAPEVSDDDKKIRDEDLPPEVSAGRESFVAAVAEIKRSRAERQGQAFHEDGLPS